jgi:hypothetical protein
LFAPDLRSRRRLAAVVLLLAALLLGCGGQDVEQASARYKARKDAASLQIVSACLKTGMARSEVEALLGEADYSPIDGQEYYASQQGGPDQDKAGPTLVVDYRDAQGEVTDALHQFWIGAVGE